MVLRYTVVIATASIIAGCVWTPCCLITTPAEKSLYLDKDQRSAIFADGIAAFNQPDYAKAHQLLLPLAESGDARAAFMICGNFYVGWGVSTDYAKVREWCTRAQSKASRADFDLVLAIWRALAESGDPLAQVMLGNAYRYGFGVPVDPAEAMKWIKRAADGGNARGQYLLGESYEYGNGVPRSVDEAMKWYGLAAAQGDTWAQYNLGVIYQFGNGVRKDNRAAAEWYRKGAEGGNRDAQYNLAVLYDNGQGVSRDLVEAAKWYRLAAEQGEPLAQNNLAVMYLKGKGLPKDPIAAYQWSLLAWMQLSEVENPKYRLSIGVVSRKSANLLSDAQQRAVQFDLGQKFRDGLGLPRDNIQAYRLIDQSAQQETDTALREERLRARDELATVMRPYEMRPKEVAPIEIR